jgi:hypothetical protein
VTATLHHRRPRFAVLVAAIALVLAATPAALAQEEDGPASGVACDADGIEVELDDETGDEFYVVPAGAEVECDVWGLTDELAIDWEVAIYGITADDLEDIDDLDDLDVDEDLEPIVVHPGEDADAITSSDGEATLTFRVPEDLVFGWFEGEVLQFGEAEEPVFEEYFEGLIFGDLELPEGDLVCEPDPAPQGAEVECVAEEMTPGAFEWEVYFLTVDELLEGLFGDGDLTAASDGGEGEADAEGTGDFTFEVPVGDAEVYLAIAEQDDYLAFYVGEVGPPATGEEPVEEDDGGEPEEEDGATVTVPRPTRVDAGAGGTAPSYPSPLAATTLGVALSAAVLASRAVSRGR